MTTDERLGVEEALDIVTLREGMLGLVWSCTCRATGAGDRTRVLAAANDHARSHLAALLDRERRATAKAVVADIELAKRIARRAGKADGAPADEEPDVRGAVRGVASMTEPQRQREHTHGTGGAWSLSQWVVPGCLACAPDDLSRLEIAEGMWQAEYDRAQHLLGVALQHKAEALRLRQGVEKIITDRYAGNFDGLIPKMRALLDAQPE